MFWEYFLGELRVIICLRVGIMVAGVWINRVQLRNSLTLQPYSRKRAIQAWLCGIHLARAGGKVCGSKHRLVVTRKHPGRDFCARRVHDER